MYNSRVVLLREKEWLLRLNRYKEEHFLLDYGAFGWEEIVGSLGLHLPKSCGIRPLFLQHYGLRHMDTIPPLASVTSIQIGKLLFPAARTLFVCTSLFLLL